jgi:DNA-binding GntR family transcriptional regulator
MPANFAQHSATVDAIAAGDPAAAKNMLITHLSQARDHVMDPHARARAPARS